jgi:hypothetical protein
MQIIPRGRRILRQNPTKKDGDGKIRRRESQRAHTMGRNATTDLMVTIGQFRRFVDIAAMSWALLSRNPLMNLCSPRHIASHPLVP